MKIKMLGIGNDCVSLFTKKDEKFIGYIGRNMNYFETSVLKSNNLFEGKLIDKFRQMIKNNEVVLNDIKFIDV